MQSKERDLLKHIIHKCELDKPTANFTSVVMEEIVVEDVVTFNPVVRSLLKRYGIEEPSVDFTHRIVTQVYKHKSIASYKPLISFKMRCIIATSLTAFIISLNFSEHASASPTGLTLYLTRFGRMLNAIFMTVKSIPSLYLLTFISLSILLAMDYLLKNKRTKTQS